MRAQESVAAKPVDLRLSSSGNWPSPRGTLLPHTLIAAPASAHATIRLVRERRRGRHPAFARRSRLLRVVDRSRRRPQRGWCRTASAATRVPRGGAGSGAQITTRVTDRQNSFDTLDEAAGATIRRQVLGKCEHAQANVRPDRVLSRKQ